ncbi:MAG: HD domain-containing protein [candidate division WOR-3 bacterium]
MLKKEVWVKDLLPGVSVTEMFVITEIGSGPRPSGNEPLKFNLRDRTGIIRAHLWYDSDMDRYRELYEKIRSAYEEQRIVLVEGVVKTYKGERDLEVRRFEVLEDGEFEEFPTIPSIGEERIQSLWEEMVSFTRKRLAEEGETQDVAFAKRLLDAFFSDPDLSERFKRSPGAKYYHHAVEGGLLEHTYNVLRLATGTALLFRRTYEKPVSVPLVIAGAVLHDVGKIESYSVGRRDIRDTYEGQTIGHIFLGMTMVIDLAKRTFGNEEMSRLPALLHIIASHHGYAEFGAPIEPKFPEAFIVYYADDLDAKLEHISRLPKELPAFSEMLRRVIYPPKDWGED